MWNMWKETLVTKRELLNVYYVKNKTKWYTEEAQTEGKFFDIFYEW